MNNGLTPSAIVLLRWEHVEVGALMLGAGFLLCLVVLFAVALGMVVALSRRVSRLEERVADIDERLAGVEASLRQMQHQLNNMVQGMRSVTDHLLHKEARP